MSNNIYNQLKDLKEVKPDSEWVKRNREILLTQITSAQTEKKHSAGSFVQNYFLIPLRAVSMQPLVLTAMCLVVVLGSGLLGIKISEKTKPGDSLYIAKIAGEKTQFAFAFDDKKKAQLGLEFANNRAEEIKQVLAEPESKDKDQKVGELVDNFKRELDTVKSHIQKINTNLPADKLASDGQTPNEEETSVFSANFDKQENGIQVGESGSQDKAVAKETPTSTPLQATTTSAAISQTDPQEIIKQAGDLLDKEDYQGTISKIEEAGSMMSKVDSGKVKGESEDASSTKDNLNTKTNSTSTKAK